MSSVERAVCTPRIRTIQISSLTLIFLISMLNYMDRGTLSVANPLIRNELGLSISQMGVLLSAFLWPYALALGTAAELGV
jgi:sugar phosphate permease